MNKENMNVCGMRRQGERRGQTCSKAEGQEVSGKESVENVRGMRRQGEIHGKASSKTEGQGVSGKDRFDLFFFCEGKQGLERMLSWGNHGCPSNYKAKPSFFQSVGKSRDSEAKRFFRVEYLHAEGQAVSGEHRFGLFMGCGGKGKYAVQFVQRPKGRAFQEKIG